MPNKSADKTLQELVRMMVNHQDPKPNPIAERFKFNNRDRKPEKSRAEYISIGRTLWYDPPGCATRRISVENETRAHTAAST